MSGGIEDSKLVGSPDNTQVGGQHYKTANPAQQHWNLAVDLEWNYLQAQVIKYMMRYRNKNGVQDLEKARHFLDKLIEVEKSKCGVYGTVSSNTEARAFLASTI